MCQGVVASLVKFTANGKKKTVVMSGIGSHSDLIKDNVKKLKRAGWKENASGESVISIESDFSGWNKYTVEAGKPSDAEIKILNREYKKCAGNAGALIAHVKRCKKIDDALVALLSADGTKIYDAKLATLDADYDAKCAPLYADYEAKRAPLYADYEAKLATLWIRLFSKKENRVERLQ